MNKSTRHRYPSAYPAARAARHDLFDFARSCGVSEQDINDIVLAAGEAVNNAVEHGHMANASFCVRASCVDDRFTVEVEDSGQGFDLAGKGERMSPHERGARGLGIFIMRSLMDEVTYAISPSGTCVRLMKATHAHDTPQTRNTAGTSPAWLMEASGDVTKPRFESVRRHLSRRG